MRDSFDRLRDAFDAADAVLVGIGAGMSASAGFAYDGERFMEHFSDFHDKYGISDMYSGGFYPFRTQEEHWAWWSRTVLLNRYDCPVGKPYDDLVALLKGKEHFIITTNVDHQLQRAGADRQRLFYTQGDYGLFQCPKPCHDRTYDNEAAVRAMVASQKDMRVDSSLIPRCPVCGRPMAMNLRIDSTFVEDEGWHRAAQRYGEWLERNSAKRLLLLELGVGGNTPGIIKIPFWQMAMRNPEATYCTVNKAEAYVPPELESRSIAIREDIASVLEELGS